MRRALTEREQHVKHQVRQRLVGGVVFHVVP
jgi:hypothetical protein